MSGHGEGIGSGGDKRRSVGVGDRVQVIQDVSDGCQSDRHGDELWMDGWMGGWMGLMNVRRERNNERDVDGLSTGDQGRVEVVGGSKKLLAKTNDPA
jgi:hypothetical protein